MSDKISREDAQAEINGLLVAEICRDFAINFRDVYPAHILARGVGPEQAFIGLAIKRGHLALPAVQFRVKPLVWSDFREGGCIGKPHPFQFFITQAHDGKYLCHHDTSWHDDLAAAQAHAQEAYQTAALEPDNTGGDTIATLYGALAQRQQPLGAEFGAAIFSDVESLYDDNPGKETAMSDLLPCPFCGGEAEWKSGGPGSAWVSCKSCPAETDDGAIPRIRDAWNTRALPAVQPDAAAHGAEHWDTLAPWSKYSSDVVLVVHHILTEPAVPTATVRFELPERAGSGVLGHCAADTVEEAVMGAIDAAQAKLRAMINTGKEVMPLDAGTTETQTQAHDIGPGDRLIAGAAPWPEGLIHRTNTRRFPVDCATEGCGRPVRTRFAGRDYCEPCGRKVAGSAQKGGA